METVYSNMPWLMEYIVVATPITDALRALGFGLLKVFSTMIDSAYSAIESLLLLNLMEIEPIQNFVNTVSPLGWAVLTISIVLAGIFIMFHPSKGKSTFAQGMLIALIFTVSIPFLFTALNQFKDAAVGDLSTSISQEGKPGQQLLRSSVVDVEGSTEGIKTLGENVDPYYLEINDRISRDNQTFQYKILKVEDEEINGEIVTKIRGDKLGDGFFGLGKEELYAYNYKFVETLLIQLVTLVGLVFAGFKIGRNIYDVAFYQVAAPIVYASDVNNNGRSKKFTQNLIGIYISFMIILVLMKIYLDLTSWATINISNIWVKIFLLAGASWGLINGPDAVIHLIGIDAGVKNSGSLLMGAASAMNVIGGAGHAIGGIAQKAGNMAGSAAGSVAGGVTGLAATPQNYSYGKDMATDFGTQMKEAGGLVEGHKGFREINNSRFENGEQQQTTSTAGYNNTPPPARSGIGGIIDSAKSGYRNTSEGIQKTAASIGYRKNYSELAPPNVKKPQESKPVPVQPANYQPPKQKGDL